MKVILATLSLLLVAAAPRRPVVLFVGDGVTAGFGVTRSESYPAQVESLAAAAGWNIVVENESRSGDTIKEALERAAPRFKRPFDVLIVALGTNDALQKLPAERSEKSLRRLLDRAYAGNPRARIVIVGARAPLESGAYAQRFNPIFRRAAWEYRTAYLPFLLEEVIDVPALTLADRIHPNAAGHRKIAEKVWGVLEPVLKRGFAAPSPAP